MLLSSRTLIGLAIGADSAIATAYIAEFAPRERRGQLSIIQQWMITVGILVSYLVAVVVLLALPHNARSEEHTSELQSQSNIVCRLLLEKKKFLFPIHMFLHASTYVATMHLLH